MNTPAAQCPLGHLCAVGSSTNFEAAKHQASLGLAQIFRQHLVGKFQSQLQSDGEESRQWLSEEVESSADMALSGVNHPHTFERFGHFYVLASLDKQRAARDFSRRIEALDGEMGGLWRDKRTGALFALEKKWRERATLAAHYTFLLGLDKPPPITREQSARKKQRVLGRMVIQLELEEDTPPMMAPAIAEILARAGYTLASDMGTPAPTHFLRGRFEQREVPVNVPGFRRFRFALILEASGGGGHLHLERFESGRHLAQIQKRALAFFRGQIEQSLDKISFVP